MLRRMLSKGQIRTVFGIALSVSFSLSAAEQTMNSRIIELASKKSEIVPAPVLGGNSNWILHSRYDRGLSADQFGRKIAMSDDGSVAWVYGKKGQSTSTTIVLVYERISTSQGWQQISSFNFSGPIHGMDLTPTHGVIGGSDKVHVYQRSGSSFNPTQVISGQVDSGFGDSVAINATADVIVVGAPFESASNYNPWNHGAAYVLELDTQTSSWTIAQQLQSNTAPTNFSMDGYDVDIFDETIVVGRPELQVPGWNYPPQGTGTVRVFDRDFSGIFTQTAVLEPDNYTADFMSFGFAVSIHGNTIAVGAPQAYRDAIQVGIGAGYIYTLGTSNVWTQIDFMAPNAGSSFAPPRYQFGYDVKLTGNQLVFGAPTYSVPRPGGGIYTYERTFIGGSNAFIFDSQLQPCNSQLGDQFGSTVAISDTHQILVGAWGKNANNVSDTGEATFWSRTWPGSVDSCLDALVLDLSGVFLEGAMVDDPIKAMSGLLANQLLIPAQEPYAGLGYNYPTVLGPVVASSPNTPNIQDWVVVELRDAQLSQVIAAQPGLLDNTGRVTGKDGTSPLEFQGIPGGNYTIAIHHRNHLNVASAVSTLFLLNTTVNFDLQTNGLYGIDGHHTVFSQWANANVDVMITGDANRSELVDAADRMIIWLDRNQYGYLNSDIDLNGIVDAADRSWAWNNRDSMPDF